MKMSDYPQLVRDAWTVHEIFRRLGFSADDIYLQIGRDAAQPAAPWVLFVSLRAQRKEFNVAVGPAKPEEDESIRGFWGLFCEDLKTFPDAVLRETYEKGLVRRLGETRLLMAMAMKGFKLPKDLS